jgi:hypothetical protein
VVKDVRHTAIVVSTSGSLEREPAASYPPVDPSSICVVPHRLFSYGTLRQPDVQAALFGRSVTTTADSLPGYRLEWLLIADPNVIATSGTDRHPLLRRGVRSDSAAGVRLELSYAELKRADAYEVAEYRRIPVVLASGVDAWVYVAAADDPSA